MARSGPLCTRSSSIKHYIGYKSIPLPLRLSPHMASVCRRGCWRYCPWLSLWAPTMATGSNGCAYDNVPPAQGAAHQHHAPPMQMDHSTTSLAALTGWLTCDGGYAMPRVPLYTNRAGCLPDCHPSGWYSQTRPITPHASQRCRRCRPQSTGYSPAPLDTPRMLCACLVSVCPAEYSPISLPTASPRCSPVPQATARARGAVALGAGDAGRPRCPGQAIPGARWGTPRGAGGARKHHGQVHRAGHDGVVDRCKPRQRILYAGAELNRLYPGCSISMSNHAV